MSELVDGLDLGVIEDTYEEERGYPPYHPRMMVKVLLYAYATGIYSSRRIARGLVDSVALRYLAAGNQPDFRTISDFRKRHGKALRGLFGQVVRLCRRAGLVKLGHVAVDGTKIKANASKHKAMSYPLGVSVPTIPQWLGVLETIAQVLVVPPFYENLGKRLIKSPKLYLADSGLACHLLGITTAAELARSPFAGALFEGFIASEIVKAQVNSGRRREIYHFRDVQGLEVDFVVPGRGGGLTLVECKHARTVTPAMAAPMRRLADSVRRHRAPGTGLDMYSVHEAARNMPHTEAVAPGVRARSWRRFVDHVL